jgi:hypothetical protein
MAKLLLLFSINIWSFAYCQNKNLIDTIPATFFAADCDTCSVKLTKGYLVAEKKLSFSDNMFNDVTKPDYAILFYLDMNKKKISKNLVIEISSK